MICRAESFHYNPLEVDGISHIVKRLGLAAESVRSAESKLLVHLRWPGNCRRAQNGVPNEFLSTSIR